MKLLDRNWNGGNVEFTINGDNYIFDSSYGIKIEEHAFNNSGSKATLKNVYPVSYSRDDLNNKPFKLPKYSFAEIKVDGKIIMNGFIKKQTSLDLSPFSNKYIDITIVTKKEFLTHLPMDFPVVGMKYESIVDKVLSTLNMPELYSKGTMSFPNGVVEIYDGKNKSAFDILQMISDQSNTALVIKDTDDGKSTINFYRKQDILNGGIGNKGINITFDTADNKKAWWSLYRLESFIGKENNLKDVNYVRVESEKVISTKSQEEEFDLSKNQDSISTPNPIGKLDRTNTVLLNPDRTVNRKLIIATNSEKKAADLIYTPNGQTVTLNSRLVGKNLLLKLSYKPILREAFDVEDAADQKEVAQRTKTDGKLFRYEKHNDMSTGADMLATARKYLEAGTDNKIIWTVKSRLPIWELGMFTEFIGDSNLNDMDASGGYIVKEVVIDINDKGQGILTKTFTYKLVKTIDLQNDWNYYDSQQRRDKTFTADEAEVTESIRTTSENVIIELVNLEKTCGDLVNQPSLEISLESNLSGSGNMYPIWEI